MKQNMYQRPQGEKISKFLSKYDMSIANNTEKIVLLICPAKCTFHKSLTIFSNLFILDQNLP